MDLQINKNKFGKDSRWMRYIPAKGNYENINTGIKPPEIKNTKSVPMLDVSTAEISSKARQSDYTEVVTPGRYILYIKTFEDILQMPENVSYDVYTVDIERIKETSDGYAIYINIRESEEFEKTANIQPAGGIAIVVIAGMVAASIGLVDYGLHKYEKIQYSVTTNVVIISLVILAFLFRKPVLSKLN